MIETCADSSTSATDWRRQMPRDDRIRVCQYIMQKLTNYYTNVAEDVIKDRTRTFEAQAFGHARNRREYLEKIAEGLSRVETSVREQRAAGMHAADAQLDIAAEGAWPE